MVLLLLGAAPTFGSNEAVALAKSSVTFGFVLALECQPEAGQVALDRAKDHARLTLEAAGLSPDDATAQAAALLAGLHIQPMAGDGKASMCDSMLTKYSDSLPFLWLELNLE